MFRSFILAAAVSTAMSSPIAAEEVKDASSNVRDLLPGQSVGLGSLLVTCTGKGFLARPLTGKEFATTTMVPAKTPSDWKQSQDITLQTWPPDRSVARCKTDAGTIAFINERLQKRLQGRCGADEGGETVQVFLGQKRILDKEYEGGCGDLHLASLEATSSGLKLCEFVPQQDQADGDQHHSGEEGYPLPDDLDQDSPPKTECRPFSADKR